jgi:glycerol-3-phosphate acyltransferase PlsY
LVSCVSRDGLSPVADKYYQAIMLHPLDWSLVPDYAAALAFGYLCGSIPFGVVLTRLAGAPDLRTVGSGNIGATNVLRTGRKALAAATLAGDMLKGTVAVAITSALFGRDPAMCAALGAFLGHLFPVWLGFKGGKGVATYIGLLLGFGLWIAVLAFCVIWLAIAAASRYSSLAALIASAATPALLWWRGDTPAAELFFLLTVLVWIMHRANIARLIGGTESRIGRGKAATG